MCLLGQLTSDTQPSTDARITLPRLSDLTLRRHYPAVSNVFLGHLVLPSLTHLTVHGYYFGDIEEHIPIATLPTLLPTDPGACIPFLGKMTSVALRSYEQDYTMTGFLDNGTDRPNLELSIASDSLVKLGEYFPLGSETWLTSFAALR